MKITETIRIISIIIALALLTGCSSEGFLSREKGIPLSYDNEIPENGIQDDDDYNHDLFFRNDALFLNSDPFILHVTDTDSTEYGYYYLYGTNMSDRGFETYRSKDLQNWEQMSSELGYYAFEYQEDYTLKPSYWAPEVIYDEDTDQYYMFYSGTLDNSAWGNKYLGVATSKEPYGPFEPFAESGLDATVLIDKEKANEMVDDENKGDWVCIDASPFYGADGEKYLLFCRVADSGDSGNDSVWGMRMNSWTSPDYSTLTKLTSVGYLTADKTEKAVYEADSPRNEGPHMYVRKHEDGTATYYLTYSINGLNDYAVCQAVGESPLGPFVKPTEADGGILLANDNLTWDHIKGPGHHCFIEVEDELYIVYHQQMNREMGDSWDRTLAMDRIKFTENESGQEVMVANGPTWSLQPQIEAFAEYTNIASDAKVSATQGDNVEALTDGLLSMYKGIEFVKEFESSKTTTITLDFGEYREITGLMIYNSKWFEKAFVEVDRIEFDFRNDELPDGATAYIEDLEFDWTSYKNAITDDMRPGGSAVAVFEPLEVKEIRITFELPIERPELLQLLDDEGYVVSQEMVNVSEIAVLGK